MVAKSILFDGYGAVSIQPISIKDKETETVDSEGNPLTLKYSGERAKSFYVTAEGVEVPRSQVCKKINVEDEDMILSKFSPTKEIAKDNIKEIDDVSLIYNGIDRKFYSVVTDNEKIKDLVITQNKSLEFPFIAGGGWKIWRGILTNWNGKILMVLVRGDIQKELEKYSEETVEFEIDIIPQQENMKKLVTAMAMV